MAKQNVISLSTTELLAKLRDDFNLLLELRNTNHFRRGRPDECDSYEAQDEYEENHTDHDTAWERWADLTYDTNNRMGTPLADAVKIIDALERWWNAEGTDTEEEEASAPAKVVIEVLGGVAEVTQQPDGVEVEIIDHDEEDQ